MHNLSDDSNYGHLIGSESSESISDIDTSDLSASEISSSESVSSAGESTSAVLNSTSDSNKKKSSNVFSQKDEPLCEGSPHTVFTASISVMLYAQKFSLTGEGLSALLKMIHSFLPKPCKLTTSVYRLKDFLKSHIGFQEPLLNYFCETCGISLAEGTRCSNIRCERLNSKSLVFHDLGFEHQLKELFKGIILGHHSAIVILLKFFSCSHAV